jgi:hypothetical protein
MRKLIWIALCIAMLFHAVGANGSIDRRQPKKPRKPVITRPAQTGEGGGSRIVMASMKRQDAKDRASTKYDAKRVTVRTRTCPQGWARTVPETKPGEPVYAYGRKDCTDGTTIIGAFCVRNCPGAATKEEEVELPSLPEIEANLLPPLPTPRLSPPLENVRASNIGGYLVGMRTYFAVEPSSWTDVVVPPISRAGATLTLTGVPKALEITIGKDTFECDGPGVIITQSNVNQMDSLSDECSVIFEDAGTESVEVRIRYENVYGASGFPVPPILPVGEPSFSPPLVVTLPIVEVQPVLRTID